MVESGLSVAASQQCLFFWLGAINVMEMFTYVPNRVFIEGDITEFYRGFGISPFWVFIPGTVLVLWSLYRFYSKEIQKLYALFRSESYGVKRFLLYLTFWPLAITFIYWVMPKQHVILSFLTNVVSILIVIYLVILGDPHEMPPVRSIELIGRFWGRYFWKFWGNNLIEMKRSSRLPRHLPNLPVWQHRYYRYKNHFQYNPIKFR